MKTNRLFMVLFISLVVTSCASDAARQRKADKIEAERKIAPEKKAEARTLKLFNRVQIVMYDPSPRVESDHLDVFDETRPIQRPHKDIAVLTCEGTPGEEAEMIQAIIKRARLVGANALIILQPSRSGWGDRRVFRAKAAVFDETPKK